MKVPAWFIAVLVFMLLPLALWPFIMSEFLGRFDESSPQWLLMVFFPVYGMLTCWLAYHCYVNRREISYILLAVLLLSYGALLMM